MKIEFIVTVKKVETSFSPLPEDHWSSITHLRDEDMLKSAVIEEKILNIALG